MIGYHLHDVLIQLYLRYYLNVFNQFEVGETLQRSVPVNPPLPLTAGIGGNLLSWGVGLAFKPDFSFPAVPGALIGA